ncbi:MAG: hypothetical protein IH586_09135 [Anaerolineaceae bacterium]|nr:hypothetical protein [Anaerolineaceae bacterium]
MFEVEIIVKGWIDKEWCDWLGGLAISYCEPDISVLSGVLPDQAAAFGILARMRDFGFRLFFVRIKAVEKDR